MKNYHLLLMLLVGSLFCNSSYGGETAPTGNSIKKPFLSGNKVWEYVAKFGYDNFAVYRLTRYSICESTEIDGKEYKTLYQISESDWIVSTDDDGNQTVKDGDSYYQKYSVAYLREEGDKVYIKLPDSSIHTYNPDAVEYSDRFQWVETNPGEDTLLYDFSMKDGDTATCNVRHIGGDFLFDSVVAPVKACCTSEENLGEETLRRISLVNPVTLDDIEYLFDEKIEVTSENVDTYGMVWVEGIGSVGHGILYETGGYPAIPETYANAAPFWEMFNNLYDTDGNVLYPGLGISYGEASGISHIHAPSENSLVTYDLMGQRVDRLLPGSIYIRNGKKFIAR